MEDEIKLTVKIENSQPVELIDLTESLMAFGDEYKRFMQSGNSETLAGAELRLYVKEIRTGSIITDVVALAPLYLPYIEHAKTVITYAKHLKTVYDYFVGRSKDKPALDKTSYNNFAKIIEPVAKDHGSQMFFSPTINGNVTFNVSLTSMEANAAQNTIYREVEQLKAAESKLHEKVLLHWYQAKKDPESKTGDRATIEDISNQPKKIIFASDSIKAEMLLKAENPFRYAYVVDVMVETVQNRPVAYKILHVHDKEILDEGLFDNISTASPSQTDPV